MAFNNITNPGRLVMAGNPVLFTGNTNAVGTYHDAEGNERKRLFPCVIGKFTSSSGYEEEYTYPLGSDGNFQFDLSEALQECFRQSRKATLGSDGPTHSPQSITYTLKLTERWHDDGVAYTGDTVTIRPDGNTSGTSAFSAIPGALTDSERSKMSGSNIADLLTSGKVLSRKPADTEVVIKDTYHILPYMSGASPAYDRTKRSATGAFTLRGHKIYVTDDAEKFMPIVFWNQFGLLESATAYGNPAYQHNLQSSQYEVDNGRSFNSIGEQHAKTSLQQQFITLSSGIVSRTWYEWWIAEVLTTPQVFIRLDGRWYSGTIVPDSNITHQEGKGDALSVEFKVKLSVKGSIYNSWV